MPYFSKLKKEKIDPGSIPKYKRLVKDLSFHKIVCFFFSFCCTSCE